MNNNNNNLILCDLAFTIQQAYPFIVAKGIGNIERRVDDGCIGGDYERNKEEATTITEEKYGNNVGLAAADGGCGGGEKKMEEAALQ
ncbi:hypothetical protein TSUD_315230 [Trifolium subterraneum]|uniref:Uncharacterized protein n=1 Tax=Trifolium subterraneum TaxID=3900 RepID=A0A2Z6MFH2_TRISU|nr:hypothetical protein TSUD_315230 [Trifolium subterraneum]